MRNRFSRPFELIGGVPALVQLGSSDPAKCYAIYAKLLPSETETPVGGVTINAHSNIPKNALTFVSIEETGKVIDLDEVVPEGSQSTPIARSR